MQDRDEWLSSRAYSGAHVACHFWRASSIAGNARVQAALLQHHLKWELELLTDESDIQGSMQMNTRVSLQ